MEASKKDIQLEVILVLPRLSVDLIKGPSSSNISKKASRGHVKGESPLPMTLSDNLKIMSKQADV